MSLSNSIKILNPLINTTGYLTTVDQIYDPSTGKTQQEINKETNAGKNIESIGNYYAIANFSTFTGEDIYNEMNWILIPNEDGIEAPVVDPINKYLWNYEVVKYNDGELYKTTPTVIGVYSEGRGIHKVSRWYLINNIDNVEPNVNDVNWKEYSEATTDAARYLWRKTETFYTDDLENPEIEIELIGVHGTKGIDGVNVEYVYLLLSETEDDADGNKVPKRPTAPTAKDNISNDSLSDASLALGWSDEPHDISKEKPYLWISERKKDTVNNVWEEYMTPTLWAVYGKSIISITTKYTINNDSTTHPSLDETDENGVNVWKDYSPAVTTQKPYLWKYTQTILTGGDEREEFEMIGAKGEKGVDGLDIEYIYIRTVEWDGINKPQLPNPLEDKNGNTNTNVDDFIPKGWADEPEGVSEDIPYQWMRMRKKDTQNNNWGDFSDAKLWAVYGKSILNIEKLYQISSDSEKHPDESDNDADTNINNWLKVSPAVTDAKPYLWEKTITTMTGGEENILYALIGVKGRPGTDGADIEYIYYKTEEWDGTDENKPTISLTGTVPEIDEDGKLTGNRVEGSAEDDDFVPAGWTDEPEDASKDYPYIWCSMRKKKVGSSVWGDFSVPKLWTKYGEDGNSLLDSVSEYARSSKSDIIPGTVDGEGKDISGWDSTTGWQPNSPVVTDEYPYLWKKTTMTYSKPLESEENNTKIIYEMIGVKGNKGIDGTDVEYAYILTKSIETNEDGIVINRPDSPINEVSTNSRGEWSDDPFDVDETWKYEWISYRKLVDNEWGPWSEPKLWAKYGADGVTPIDIYNEYMISDVLTDNPDSTKSVPEEYLIDNEVQWQTSSPATNNTYKYLWKKTTTTYSKDFEINGVLTESRQTVVYDMMGTHGDPGVDGSTVDYIYSLTSTLRPIGYNQITAPLSGNKKVDVVDGNGNEFVETWYDEPQDISEQNQYLWISSAKKESGSDNWSAYSLPTLWAKYGVDGNGIIGVEVSYMKSDLSKSDGTIETRNESIDLPTTPQAHVWYTSSPELDDTYKYLWKRTKTTYNQALTGNLGGNIDYKYEMIGTLGEKGIDGAGSEWAYKLTKTFTKPNSEDIDWPTNSITTNIRGKWTDDPQGFELDDEYLYEWEIKRNKAAGDTAYGPWGMKDGDVYYASLYNTRGKSIKNTVAYYISIPTNSTPSIPSKSNYNTVTEYINALVADDWTTESSFSKLNKYVWEVQIIEYTDGGYDIIGPVFKGNYSEDGGPGNSSYMLYVDTQNIVVPYDPKTSKISESKRVKINLTLKYGTTTENLSSYDLTATAYKNDGTEPLIKTIDIPADKSYITYNFSNLIVYTNYADYIDLIIKNGDGELVASSKINITYLQFGEVGPSGQAGRMAYPAGNYDNTRKYTRTDKTTPYVYYNDKYYVLDVDEATGQIPSASSESWEEFESFEAIYTKFLMADYANLGSQAGAIVYDNFLFSQMGENKNGEDVHYSIYSENNEIFISNDAEETGNETLLIADDSSTGSPTDTSTSSPVGSDKYKPSRFTGNFVPNTFVDFYKGSIACNKFSEHYGKFYLWKNNDPNLGVIQNTYYMDLEKEHNLIIQPRLQTYMKSESGSTRYFLARPGVVVLPDYATNNRYNEDGTHVCISYPNPGTPGGYLMSEFDFNGNINDLNYNVKDGSIPGTEGYILVCADARIFDSENYVSYNDGDNRYYYKYRNPNNFSNSFSWKGYNCKFILMHAGSILKLRSCITGANLDDGFVIPNQRTWMIENAEDFDFAPVDINIYNSKGEDKMLTFKSCYNGTGFITIGSCNSSYEYNLIGMTLDTSTDIPPTVTITDIKAKQLSKSVFSSSSVGTVFESISLSNNLPFMTVYGVTPGNNELTRITPTFNVNGTDHYMGVEIPESNKIYTGKYENGMVIGLDISKTMDTVNEKQNHISSNDFLDNGAQVTTKILNWGDKTPSTDYKYIVCGHE